MRQIAATFASQSCLLVSLRRNLLAEKCLRETHFLLRPILRSRSSMDFNLESWYSVSVGCAATNRLKERAKYVESLMLSFFSLALVWTCDVSCDVACRLPSMSTTWDRWSTVDVSSTCPLRRQCRGGSSCFGPLFATQARMGGRTREVLTQCCEPQVCWRRLEPRFGRAEEIL